MSTVKASDRHPDTKLQAALKTRELAIYSLTIIANDKTFDPKRSPAVIERITGLVMDAHMKCWIANQIRVTDKEAFEARRRGQTECIRTLTSLLPIIDIAWKLFHLSSKRVEFWTRLVVDARELVRAWRSSDAERYKQYR